MTIESKVKVKIRLYGLYHTCFDVNGSYLYTGCLSSVDVNNGFGLLI